MIGKKDEHKKQKVIMLGNSNVGKTSIIKQFNEHSFGGQVDNTIGANFTQKTVHRSNGDFDLYIWDTAGQERFRSLIPMYMRGSTASVVVADVSSRLSVNSIEKWYQVIQENCPNSKVYIVANKIDLIDDENNDNNAVENDDNKTAAENNSNDNANENNKNNDDENSDNKNNFENNNDDDDDDPVPSDPVERRKLFLKNLRNAEDWAIKNNFPFFKMTAKKLETVEPLFLKVADDINESYQPDDNLQTRVLKGNVQESSSECC